MKHLSLLWLGLCLAVQASPASAPPSHYRIEVDVYVTDERALCQQAWRLATADHSHDIATLITKARGEFVASKCLATVYQKRSPDGVASAGIHVMEVSE
jgi:hypothetical protein